MLHKMTNFIMLHLVGNRAASALKLSKQLKYYKYMKKEQWNELDNNIEAQKKKLYHLLCFAVEQVPYYKSLGLKSSEFSEETILEDLKKFPILTKEIIRREGDNMYPIKTLDEWTFDNVSGGTTGEPVKFRHSGSFFDWDQAGKLLFDTWSGRRLGEKQIRLWGSERDIISGKKDWMNKVYRWMRNETFLNTFRMTEKDMEEFIACINHKRPAMILAYVQSARELAQYIERNGKYIVAPKGMMTSAGVLDEDTYKLLKRVFRCPIINRYGSREMGDMACSCDRNEGLHINLFTSYIEIVDDRGMECDTEEDGNILTTSLVDYSMPIIRYAIGDRGACTDKKCSCGRGMPLMKYVKGRVIDIFTAADCAKVDGEFFTHLFYVESQVKQFQVIQHSIENIEIKVVFYDDVRDINNIFERIRANVLKVMGENVNVDFKIVNDIPVSASGKRIYTISHVK